MNAPIRIKDPNAPGRQYSFTLGFGGMAALLAALTLSLTLFFVLGVLVGRGHRPEAALPVVAGIMPREMASRPAQPAPEVLKEEDLGYSEQLGKKHEGPAPTRAIDKVERKAPEKPGEKKDDKSAAKPGDKSAEKPSDKAAKPGDKTAAKPGDKSAEKKTAQQPDPDNQRYDYAYQAASFPDPEQAKAFLKRVKGLGLKGDIESGNTNGKAWHRVVVFFQGTPTDTRTLKEKLGSIGAQQPLLRSKAAI